MPRASRQWTGHAAITAGAPRKVVPHEFVLDALASLSPWTRPMFGCLAVYVEEQIVLILRDRRDSRADNGVWLATTAEHHASLRREFPTMRSIPGVWQKGHALAGAAGRSGGFRGGRIARVRTHPGARCAHR